MATETVAVKEPHEERQQRKEQLIREGEFYRVALVHAKAQVTQAARPEALFHSAVDHVTGALRSSVDNVLKPTGASVATLAPILVTAFRIFRSRRMGIAGIASAVAVAGFGWYMQRRRQQKGTL